MDHVDVSSVFSNETALTPTSSLKTLHHLVDKIDFFFIINSFSCNYMKIKLLQKLVTAHNLETKTKVTIPEY